jgi:hypothetical protein
MARFRPEVLTPAPLRARRDRVARVARAVGFVDRIEYRHVFSQTGGAKYGHGVVPTGDLLTVYAEAFELLAKATIELIDHGDAPEVAVRRLRGLRKFLEELL